MRPLSKELDWFNNVKSLCGRDKLNNEEFMSWAAFHASLQPSTVQQADIVALLPLFLEHAHSPAMVPHGLDVIDDVAEHANPGQTPVIAMDQPLFALGKLIQWNTPETRLKHAKINMLSCSEASISRLQRSKL